MTATPTFAAPLIIDGPKGQAKVFYLSAEDRDGYPAVFRVQIRTRKTSGTNAADFDTLAEAEAWARSKLGEQEKRSQMAKTKTKAPVTVRVLPRSEYPDSITRARGAYTPRVRFAATHPLGLYHVEDQGAGHLMAYFTPKRKGSRAQIVGGASSMAGAMARIRDHEDELLDPTAPRETGSNGPVNVFALGKRTSGTKTPTQLDREIEQFLATYEPE